MYFWKIRILRDELKREPLSETETFKYLLASTIVIGLALIPFYETNTYDIYGALLEVVIMATGVFYIYRCNGSANGHHILQRYFSLSWVLLVRWVVLAVCPIFVLYLLVMAMMSEIPEQTTLFEVGLLGLLSAGYFWRLGEHVRWVSSGSAA